MCECMCEYMCLIVIIIKEIMKLKGLGNRSWKERGRNGNIVKTVYSYKKFQKRINPRSRHALGSLRIGTEVRS